MSCGCGRSPIDRCIGWHGLSEKDYLIKKKQYEDKVKEKNSKNKTPANIQA